MKRHELTDRQWERLAPLLPPQRPPRGRPNHDHRRILNGIRWRLKTGVPWRDVPARYGPWQTLYSRYRRWQQCGVWDRILAALQAQADARGDLDWDRHRMDGSVVRAHHHAAGAKGGAATEALGDSRGGFSTKLHVRCARGGKPLVIVLTAGERNEQVAVPDLLDAGAVHRPQGGCPRRRPRRVAGDKGYRSPTVRGRLRCRGIGAVIPTKSDQRRRPRFDRSAYRERNAVERLLNRLKQDRAIATRYDKLRSMYHAGLTVAAILLWL